jgi:hypothetical protein
MTHLSIGHEPFEVPRGKWEPIYGWSQPTGFAAASVPVVREHGDVAWKSAILDANHGKMKTHKGRMGVTN